MSISSDSSVAKQIASAIDSALEGANSGTTITTDTQTTVSGNTNAHEAIQAMTNGQSKIIQAIGQASTNVQSIANEFEVVDQVAKEIIGSISLPSTTGGGKK